MSLLAVFLASVLGSVHCVAMCGGFATVAAGAAGTGTGGRRAAWGGTAAYQSGRLLGYLGLGVAAGLVGASLDLAGGALLGLHRLAALLTGAALVTMALTSLWPRRRAARAGSEPVEPSQPLVSLGRIGPRRPLGRRWLVGALRRGGPLGAAAVGLGSALLPCGWLWGYVLVAAATGAALSGAAVMLAFWAGGLPALLSVSAAAAWLRPRLGRHAPRLVAVIMLALGGLALAGKLGPAPAPVVADPASSEPPPCHAAP